MKNRRGLLGHPLYHARRFYDYDLCTKFVVFCMLKFSLPINFLLFSRFARYLWVIWPKCSNFLPGHKKGKKSIKRGKSGFWLKIVQKFQNSNFHQNLDNRTPFTLFTIFDKKTGKISHFPFPVILWFKFSNLCAFFAFVPILKPFVGQRA